MSFLRTIKSGLYAGQSKDFFQKHKDEIHDQNAKMLGVLSAIFCCVLAIFASFNLILKNYNSATPIFIGGSVFFLLCHIIYEYFIRKSEIGCNIFSNVLFWSFFIVLILINGTRSEISVYIPMFFIILFSITIAAPLYTIGSSLMAYIIYIVWVLNNKVLQVAVYDIANLTVAFVLGMIIGRVVLGERIRLIISRDMLEKLGGKDKLISLSGLLEDFETISYADLAGTEFVTYRSKELLERNIKGWTNIIDFVARMHLFANEIIIPEDRSHFMKCSDPRNIMHNLESSVSYSVDFRVMLDERTVYYKAKFVKDPESRFGVVIGIQNIDYETRQELERVEQKILAKQREKELETQSQNLEIIQALAEEYTSVYHINLNTDEMYTFRIDEQMQKMYGHLFYSNTGFVEAFNTYINDCVIEEDRAEILALCSPENLKKELLDKRCITKQYRSNLNDVIEYYEIKVVKVGSEDIPKFIILGVANRDSDIRAEKQREEELQVAKDQAESANNAKSTFLSRMSHDIRTPINGVMGMTEIAKRHIQEPERIMDCLEKIDLASEHLLGLVNDVLDMSKIENDILQISSKPLVLSELVNACSGIIESQLHEKKMTLTTEFGHFQHDHLLGDELHIRQVLINILGNSVKYTPEGGKILFKVDELHCENGNATFLFEVTDNGIGMAEDFLPHIWDAFSQVQTNTRNETGTGLGMSISKWLVDRMNGNISVKSKLGEGSTFKVTLSLPVNEIESVSAEDGKFVDLKGKRILLVEDNELNREIAEDLLSDEGIEVVTAENGQSAVEVFAASEENHFDAILMDIIMPVMDGLEATRNIRGLERCDSQTVPIVAMTANAFESDADKSYEAGMNAHLTKPLRIDILKMTLSKLIKL